MDTLFIVQAAYSSHPVLTVLYSLPLLLVSALFVFFAIGTVASMFGAPSTGPNAGFGEAMIFLLFLFFGIVAFSMSYPRPTFTDSIALKASDAQIIQKQLYAAHVNENKDNEKYVTNLLHKYGNYQSLQIQLARHIPLGKKVELLEVNRALSPFFYSCFVMDTITTEKSINDMESAISEKEQECSVVATNRLLSTMD